MKLVFKNKGITLISLVVTIVVLLILAGISISMLTGENGIIKKASDAKIATDEAQEKEGVGLAVTSSQMENVSSLEIRKENLENALKSQFGNNVNFTVTDNGDGSFTIEFDNTDKMYYVESSGKVIENDNILRIRTAEELKTFRNEVNSGNTFEGKIVLLMNDIILDINEEWKPIGLYPMDTTGPTDDEHNRPFKGIFDGKGYAIDGIKINTTEKGNGLFGIINGGTVKNLVIGTNTHITGGNMTAGIVGYLYNGTVYNCVNQSDINSNGSYVGGITGFVENSSIEKCYNFGNINSEGVTIGGIIGQLKDSNVKQLYNEAEIRGKKTVGGIIGYADMSKIEVSTNTGLINTNVNSPAGGICGGIADSTISFCYNKNAVTSTYWTGGIVGLANTGSNTIENCYNKGNITGPSATSAAIVNKKALSSTSKIKNCYCLENTVNESNASNEADDVQIKQSTYMMSIDFLNDLNNKTNNYKLISDKNNGYPMLNWE